MFTKLDRLDITKGSEEIFFRKTKLGRRAPPLFVSFLITNINNRVWMESILLAFENIICLLFVRPE